MLALVKGAGSLTESVLSKRNLFTPIYTQPKQNHETKRTMPTILINQVSHAKPHLSPSQWAHHFGPGQAWVCLQIYQAPKNHGEVESFLGWSPGFSRIFFFVNQSRFLFVVSLYETTNSWVSSSLSVFRVFHP